MISRLLSVFLMLGTFLSSSSHAVPTKYAGVLAAFRDDATVLLNRGPSPSGFVWSYVDGPQSKEEVAANTPLHVTAFRVFQEQTGLLKTATKTVGRPSFPTLSSPSQVQNSASALAYDTLGNPHTVYVVYFNLPPIAKPTPQQIVNNVMTKNLQDQKPVDPNNVPGNWTYVLYPFLLNGTSGLTLAPFFNQLLTKNQTVKNALSRIAIPLTPAPLPPTAQGAAFPPGFSSSLFASGMGFGEEFGSPYKASFALGPDLFSSLSFHHGSPFSLSPFPQENTIQFPFLSSTFGFNSFMGGISANTDFFMFGDFFGMSPFFWGGGDFFSNFGPFSFGQSFWAELLH